MSSPFPAASACPRESCKASRLKHVMQKTSALCSSLCSPHVISESMPSRTCMRCYIDTQQVTTHSSRSNVSVCGVEAYRTQIAVTLTAELLHDIIDLVGRGPQPLVIFQVGFLLQARPDLSDASFCSDSTGAAGSRNLSLFRDSACVGLVNEIPTPNLLPPVDYWPPMLLWSLWPPAPGLRIASTSDSPKEDPLSQARGQ